jgi:transposase
MSYQRVLPLNPAGASEINDRVGIVKDGSQVAYYAYGVALFVHDANDKVGGRVAIQQLLGLKVATKEEVSKTLGMTTTTLYRQQQRMKADGIGGLVEMKRGPHGAHKLTGEKLIQSQQLTGEGYSNREIARRVGVSEGTIRHAFRKGWLNHPVKKAEKKGELTGPRDRSEVDCRCPGGVAVKRDLERVRAMNGLLQEAPPSFHGSEGVNGAGVLIALPMLCQEGLIEVGEKVYASLKNGFYGLRHLLLVLAFMALLRIKTVEQLGKNSPGEFGLILGLDRAPEVKTVRRKLHELASRNQACELSRTLAKRWIEADPDSIGILYVDGHVRPYNGKHKLAKNWIGRRHLCAPGTIDTWVNDIHAQPLFVVTAEANEKLLFTLQNKIMPEIRTLVGKDRRITLCFDREAWSPKFFQQMFNAGFDTITYRKGKIEAWPEEDFHIIRTMIDGRHVEYRLAEKEIEVISGFKMREVRRLCASGHQTAVLTTRRDIPIGVLAYRMFDRWSQENFFKYMREHYGLDHLCENGIEQIRPDYLLPNPVRKKMQKELAELKEQLQKSEREYGRKIYSPSSSQCTKKEDLSPDQLASRITSLRSKIKILRPEILKTPKKVKISDIPSIERVVRLRDEMKHMIDTVKIVAYRAESDIYRMITPFYTRSEEEGRALVRKILASTADIIPNQEDHTLRVRYHTLATPRDNMALAQLCETMNRLVCVYPGADLRLVFEPPPIIQ